MQNNRLPGRKMIIFDLDDTLLQQRFIEVCAQRFNFTQALNLLRQIDYDPESITKRVALFLKGKKKSELVEIANSISLVPDTVEVVRQLKERGYIVGIISDSYQLVTRMVQRKINADFELANELLFQGSEITGEVLIPSYFHYSTDSFCKHQVCKTNALRHICSQYQVKLPNTIVVGDSDNDACMFRHAGFGIAFQTTSELLRNVAKKHIEEPSFLELLNYAP